MIHLAEVDCFLEEKLEQRLRRALASSDEAGMRGAGLLAEGRRLWDRVQKFIALGLVAESLDTPSLELACYALQLPLRRAKGLTAGRLGQISLRERAEQAAELLISLLSQETNPDLIDRTAALLRAVPQRSPATAEARLLADGVNLDDFGVTGLMA